MNTTESLDFKVMGFSLAGIALMVAAAFAIASYFNIQRRDSFVERYTTETLQLVEANPDGFSNLFVEVLQQCESELQARAAETADQWMTDVHCDRAAEALAELNVQVLRDHSSIAYVRFDDGHYQLLEASGKYNGRRPLTGGSYFPHFSYNERMMRDVLELSAGAQIKNYWQDFINYIPNKEIAVPIEIEGEIVGYIFRGVIE